MNLSISELKIIKRILWWHLICNLFKRDNEIVYHKHYVWQLCIMIDIHNFHKGKYKYEKELIEKEIILLVKNKPNLLNKMPEVIKNKMLLSLME